MTTSSSNIKSCRFYCTACFAETEFECICDGIVGYDPETGYPIVDMTEEEEAYLNHESASDVQSQETAESTPVSLHDIYFLCELGDSKTGEIVRYELSEMYDVSLDEIERLIRLKETMN